MGVRGIQSLESIWHKWWRYATACLLDQLENADWTEGLRKGRLLFEALYSHTGGNRNTAAPAIQLFPRAFINSPCCAL